MLPAPHLINPSLTSPSEMRVQNFVLDHHHDITNHEGNHQAHVNVITSAVKLPAPDNHQNTK